MEQQLGPHRQRVPNERFDRVAGLSSVKFAATNPGTRYKIRLEMSEINLAGFDELKFWMKYGSGPSIDSDLTVALLKWGLGAGDYCYYYQRTGIAPQGSGVWQ